MLLEPLFAAELRDLAIDPVPLDLVAKLYQLVLLVDDLLDPLPKQIVFIRRLRLLLLHRPLRCDHRIMARNSTKPPNLN